MAETSKKSTKKSTAKTTSKKNTSKKSTIKQEKTVKEIKEVKKEKPVEETKKEVVKEVKKETKPATKNNTTIMEYISSLPEKIMENSILVIIMLVVGLLVGMGTLALLGFRRIPKLKNGDEVVVALKGANITANELYSELKNGYGISILLDKIDSIILEEQYPDTDEIKKYIDSQIEYLKTSYGDQFEQYIQYYGFDSEEKVREYFSLNYKRNLALLDYAKSLIKEEDVKKYYDETIFGDIEASHILIKFDSSDDDSKSAALNKANDIINQLNQAENKQEAFANLAKEYSEDATKDNGGQLGYFSAGEMETAFENAAKALEVGSYTTSPVETSYGYHIILKTNQKEKTAYDEMKDDITETLAQNLLTENSETQYKALEELRNNHKVTFKDAELRQKYEEYLSELYESTTSSN